MFCYGIKDASKDSYKYARITDRYYTVEGKETNKTTYTYTDTNYTGWEMTANQYKRLAKRVGVVEILTALKKFGDIGKKALEEKIESDTNSDANKEET